MAINATSFRSTHALAITICLAITMVFAACGSDTGDSGDAPAEGSGGDPRIRSTEGTYTIDDLKTAGVKANKDYDLVWAPDRAHGLNEPYFIRQRWDYFVEHLLGADPPAEYEITRPVN